MINAATVVQFIGILITTVSGDRADVIMGRINIDPSHDRVIAYQQSKYVSNSNWEKAGSFTRNGMVYDYVRVDVENVTFDGPAGPFDYSLTAIPRLKCCCGTISRIKPAFADPNAAAKSAAHFFVTSGKYESAQQSKDEAVYTTLTLDGNAVTITGTQAGTATKRITLQADASVLVVHAPLSSIIDGTHQHAGDVSDHFLAYYQMVDTSAQCTRQPSDGGSCAPLNTCPATGKATRPAKKKTPSPYAVGDINCSSSSWP
jgi:hypothetical protein